MISIWLSLKIYYLGKELNFFLPQHRSFIDKLVINLLPKCEGTAVPTILPRSNCSQT